MEPNHTNGHTAHAHKEIAQMLFHHKGATLYRSNNLSIISIHYYPVKIDKTTCAQGRELSHLYCRLISLRMRQVVLLLYAIKSELSSQDGELAAILHDDELTVLVALYYCRSRLNRLNSRRCQLAIKLNSLLICRNEIAETELIRLLVVLQVVSLAFDVSWSSNKVGILIKFERMLALLFHFNLYTQAIVTNDGILMTEMFLVFGLTIQVCFRRGYINAKFTKHHAKLQIIFDISKKITKKTAILWHKNASSKILGTK